jgi:hypothetical protein
MSSKNLDQSLIDYLKNVPDERNPNGRRHPLWIILLIIIMGIMSGYWGYRGLGTFIERHRRTIVKILKIPQARVPSYSTIRRVMMQIDYQVLASIFNEWASQYTNLSSHQWIAIDGKSLKNTVSNCQTSQQNFVTMVSAFSHDRGEVLGIKIMENKKESEITVVRDLLVLLDLKNVVFTMDALHCQKKPSPPLSVAEMTT